MDNSEIDAKLGEEKSAPRTWWERFTKGSFSLRGTKATPVLSFVRFLLGVIFSRTHLLFGAHPLGLGLLAVMPEGIWWTLLGAVIGALTMGRAGIIYAMISIIVVFLRIIVGGSGKDGGTPPFKENLLLRISVSIIGGFIAGVYEALLSGLAMATLLFALVMIVAPPILVFALSGFFDSDITIDDIITSDARLFSLKNREDGAKIPVLFYQASALFLLFLVSLSLKEYALIGVDASYVLAGMATLFVARRFDPLRAAAVGFACTVALSTELTVGYILLGLGAGVLFRLGIVQAIIGGGAVVALWSAYAGGVAGLLSVLPEYAISGIVTWPISQKVPRERTETLDTAITTTAKDMVGTVSLHFKNRYKGSLSGLERTLDGIAALVSRRQRETALPSKEELYALIGECHKKYCTDCIMDSACAKEQELSKDERARLSTILYIKKSLSPEDFYTLPADCKIRVGLAETINRAYGILAQDKFRASQRLGRGEEIELISRMIAEARAKDEEEKSTNDALEEVLFRTLKNFGFTNACVKVYGKARPHIILAADDDDGKKISSGELITAIEKDCSLALGKPDYYKNGRVALLECGVRKIFSVTPSTVGACRSGESVSGDRCSLFENELGKFYSVIADGMGSGESAASTAEFVSELLSSALGLCEPNGTVLRLVNRLLRAKDPNYSSTLDLFMLDLYNGEASFIKSGAAPSYIKRDGSIFRITSRTAPLGIMKDIDAEKIKVEIRPLDYIIMLSDGVSASESDAPWLVELLSRHFSGEPHELAEKILDVAKKNKGIPDDMTVTVIKIEN